VIGTLLRPVLWLARLRAGRWRSRLPGLRRRARIRHLHRGGAAFVPWQASGGGPRWRGLTLRSTVPEAPAWDATVPGLLTGCGAILRLSSIRLRSAGQAFLSGTSAGARPGQLSRHHSADRVCCRRLVGTAASAGPGCRRRALGRLRRRWLLLDHLRDTRTSSSLLRLAAASPGCEK